MSLEQQEQRHTPEGGNSSRSQSQSSQESPVHTYISATKKENDDAIEKEKGIKEELKKPEKVLEKPTKTVSAVLRKSPPLTIKRFAETVQQGEDAIDRRYRMFLHETKRRNIPRYTS